MKRNYLLLMAALLLAALLAAGCGQEESASFPDENETYSEEVASLGISNRFAGVVTSSGEKTINKDEEKTIAELKVSAGDDVKKKQVLFVYDGEQAQLNYDKAALELEQLQYTLQSYTDQKAGLEREKANADASEQLSYTIQIQEADTNIREAEYNIKLKEKEVEKLKKGLEDLEVKSPITGKVQSINADGAVDQNGNALPYMVLMNTGTYRVKAYVNEANAMDLYEGAPVIVRSRVDDQTWTGHVASVDFDNPASSQQGYYSEDISEVASSSKYPFYVELDSADGLILGQHVFVEVDVEFSTPVSEDAEEIDAEEGMLPEEGMVPEGAIMPEDGMLPEEGADGEGAFFSEDELSEGDELPGDFGSNDFSEAGGLETDLSPEG